MAADPKSGRFIDTVGIIAALSLSLLAVEEAVIGGMTGRQTLIGRLLAGPEKAEPAGDDVAEDPSPEEGAAETAAPPPDQAAPTPVAEAPPAPTSPVTEGGLETKRFVGSSTSVGAEPWEVEINFGDEQAIWSKADGSTAERAVSRYSLEDGKIRFRLEAKFPQGISNLDCNGTVEGVHVEASCRPSTSAAAERLVGQLEPSG